MDESTHCMNCGKSHTQETDLEELKSNVQMMEGMVSRRNQIIAALQVKEREKEKAYSGSKDSKDASDLFPKNATEKDVFLKETQNLLEAQNRVLDAKNKEIERQHGMLDERNNLLSAQQRHSESLDRALDSRVEEVKRLNDEITRMRKGGVKDESTELRQLKAVAEAQTRIIERREKVIEEWQTRWYNLYNWIDDNVYNGGDGALEHMDIMREEIPDDNHVGEIGFLRAMLYNWMNAWSIMKSVIVQNVSEPSATLLLSRIEALEPEEG